MSIFTRPLVVTFVTLSLLVLTGSVYILYKDSACGVSNEAKDKILRILSNADGATLRMSKSESKPACPDAISYRQGNRLVQEMTRDIVEGKVPPSPTSGAQMCGFEGLHLPVRYKILAVFAPEGRKNFALRDSNYSLLSSEVDVVIDSSGPVAVMLIGYAPTVWNIKPSKQTQLLAIFVNGAHRQWVQGVDIHVPTFISTADGDGACGWLYESGAQEDVDGTARHLFGRPTDRTYRPAVFNSDVIHINDGG